MPMCGSRFGYLRHHPSQVIREQTAPVSTRRREHRTGETRKPLSVTESPPDEGSMSRPPTACYLSSFRGCRPRWLRPTTAVARRPPRPGPRTRRFATAHPLPPAAVPPVAPSQTSRITRSAFPPRIFRIESIGIPSWSIRSVSLGRSAHIPHSPRQTRHPAVEIRPERDEIVPDQMQQVPDVLHHALERVVAATS